MKPDTRASIVLKTQFHAGERGKRHSNDMPETVHLSMPGAILGPFACVPWGGGLVVRRNRYLENKVKGYIFLF
jgi:succinyl-CoA synthetase beta subunit